MQSAPLARFLFVLPLLLFAGVMKMKLPITASPK